MSGKATKRLGKIAREFNVGISTIAEYLSKKGHETASNPNAKITDDQYTLLRKEYRKDIDIKKESESLNLRSVRHNKDEVHSIKKDAPSEAIDNGSDEQPKKEKITTQKPVEKVITTSTPKAQAPKVVGKIDLDKPSKPKVAKPEAEKVVNKDTAPAAEKPAAPKAEKVNAPKAEKQAAPKAEKVDAPKVEKPTASKPEQPVAPKVEVKKEEAAPAKKEEATKKEQKTEVKAVTKPEAKVSKPAVQKSETKNSEQAPKRAPQTDNKPQAKEVAPKTVEPTQVKKAEVSNQKEQSQEVQKEIKTVIPKPDSEIKVVGKIDLSGLNQRTRPPKKTKKQKEEERKQRHGQQGAQGQKQGAQGAATNADGTVKKKRKRIRNNKVDVNAPQQGGQRGPGQGNQQGQGGGQRGPGQGGQRGPGQGGQRGPGQGGQRGPGQGGQRGPGQGGQGGQRGRFGNNNNRTGGRWNNPRDFKKEVTEEDVQKQVKETLARLTSKNSKSKGSKYRREKRQAVSDRKAVEMEKAQKEKSILKVTEFVSVNELASMMDVAVTDVIATCMSLGMFVSINQRLDAETMTLVAEEFGFKVEFISVELQEAIEQEDPDNEEDLESRPPIVTVMGHVDHGKTSLLDHIRKANVIAGEAGGITQHIGAYNVTLPDERKITFLDTPGHEAFTAMRARGAQATDIAIIIVAADDNVMPQTIEAINHASAAGVPIVFAINKIDKPGANPDKIKEKLASMNYLVEEWGGKYQSHDISAKQGLGVDELLEKVLLESEMLELKANPNKQATGTIIESELDKGRGYVSTVLVSAGTLKVGDIVIAGQYMGHVKAMFNERNARIDAARPAAPALILGLNGAPQAGDRFNVMDSEREARQITNKREQLQREQGLRTQKHITLDEIGRRIAIGNFQELNVIVKGDVDGSIEALSDSLIKLSTNEIQVNVIHKAVGQISESDVMLAAASNAIIIGFQVRPSLTARKIAEKEEIDIRLYSIIYDAIEELKSAMEGMLSPEIKEEILGSAEIQEVYKISKVGAIAGCICRDGKIIRGSKVRLIRDGIVTYTGELASLKRFKDDVKEVARGYECGMSISNYNDLKVGDTIEAYHEVEVAKKL